VALRPAEAVFVDIEPSAKNTEEGLVLRALMLCKRFRFTPRITVADDAPTALAMARFRCDSPKDLPLESLLDYASPFERWDPSDPRAKRMGYILLSLRGLGIKSLEDFTRLAPGSLVSRFGEEGQSLGRDIRESLTRPWPRFAPEERIVEARELRELETQSACEDFALVLNGLESVVDAAVARLRGRGVRAASVRVELGLECGGVRRWNLWLPVPQGSTRGMMPVLRDRMRFDLDREPLGSGVVTARFFVLETVRSRRVQGDLFHGSAEEAEAWDALLGRLCAQLGKEHVFVGKPEERHLPERAWSRVLESHPRGGPRGQGPPEKGTLGMPGRAEKAVLPPRPTRLLPQPQRLRKAGRVLTSLKDGRQWVVRHWLEGERISGEWWFHPNHVPYDRNYAQVVTEGGERLWTFATTDGNLYLHGYFD